VIETGEAVPAPPPPPPPQSAGVTEWANRTALFARMAARAYPAGNAPPEIQAALGSLWDLAAKANKLEGEVASHTRKLEALERRGRALRAEIGRKVEELAHEESRVMREASVDGEDVDKVRSELAQAEKLSQDAKQSADQTARAGGFDRAVFERAGATAATVQAKREQLARYETKKNTRETTARDLRRQIDELRGQLTRYAEALEEDLGQGREKVAQRTREGLSFEKSFSEASNLLLTHLRNKPECRDLVAELLATNKDQHSSQPSDSGDAKPGTEKRPGN
jgi:eukaryotic-like serine/threonine-protein kinase